MTTNRAVSFARFAECGLKNSSGKAQQQVCNTFIPATAGAFRIATFGRSN